MSNEKDYLYSPWRLSYVTSLKEPGCVLCRHQVPTKDKEHLIVYRGKHCYVMQNLYPYNNGHIMVVPYLHESSLSSLPEEVLHDLMDTLVIAEKVLKRVYSCEGINVGLNLGEAAGAGISEHLHFHMVPRWKGDSNFMSVINGERVIPESFESSYTRLSEGFANLLVNKE
ncbi:MAG TPA: HIT domain-containing protein [Candidatus Cloacimonadota bacterium]|mgnify:CR=1 FL=1|nr:HIT domain-containing protein [Candidatus Cloacimonadota bacterium]HPS38190.1 HIT domain-containing protein [Candidatus Cloacimonadota bacterium]